MALRVVGAVMVGRVAVANARSKEAGLVLDFHSLRFWTMTIDTGQRCHCLSQRACL